MATLVENAVRIKQTFDDIYDAIVEQGVTPSGGVDTYADAINEITNGPSITNYSNLEAIRFLDTVRYNSGYFTAPSYNVPPRYTNINDQYYLVKTQMAIKSPNISSSEEATFIITKNNEEFIRHSIALSSYYPAIFYDIVELKAGDVLSYSSINYDAWSTSVSNIVFNPISVSQGEE